MRRQQLRKHFRQARQNLSRDEQHRSEQQISLQLQNLWGNTKRYPIRVAAYLANDGEPNLDQFIKWAWQSKLAIALPVIHPFTKGSLFFQYYAPGTAMAHNKYGIAEPALNVNQIAPLDQLDVILMPLVAFDSNKNRLGMGGGYYDRTLSQSAGENRSPKLIGIAHTSQHYSGVLPNEIWDIPLDNIVTPDYVI